MDIEQRINEIFEGIKIKKFMPIAVFQGMRGIIRDVESERDALHDQLETTKRELMATTISWENALAELDRLSKQKPIGFLLEHSDGAEFYNMEMSAKFNCTDKIQASVSPVYAAPVPAMPIPKQEPAVAVPYGFVNPADKNSLHQRGYAQIESKITDYSTLALYEHQSPRITEQKLKDEADYQRDLAITCAEELIKVGNELHEIKSQKPLGVTDSDGNLKTYSDRLPANIAIYGGFAPNIRITEQDAREIIEDYIGYCDGKRLKPQSSVVMGMYIKNECTAILNKLNANAVVAQAAAIPDAYEIDTREHTKSKIYKQGWNHCRSAMLSASPKPE